MTAPLRADPGWLLAVVPAGLVAVGPGTELEVAVDVAPAGLLRLLDLLVQGARPPAVAAALEARAAEGEALLEELAAAGALVRPAAAAGSPVPRAPGTALIEALLGVLAGGGLPQLTVTADEALLAPGGLAPGPSRRVLRAFIAGIEPHGRLVAYAHAARTGSATVQGDRPTAAGLDAALAAAEPLDAERLHVVPLAGGATSSLSPEELDQRPADRPHRLGPVTAVRERPLAGARDFGLSVWVSRYALANLAHAEAHPPSWSCRGAAPEADEARTIAIAEAVERFGAGEIEGHELRRAAEGELEGAVPGDRLFRLSDAQRSRQTRYQAYDPGASYLWTPAVTLAGERRWVLAEAAFSPFADPERSAAVLPAGSHGVAAHYDREAAVRAALREVVERDAFMWAWLRRVARERIARASLPPELERRIALVEGQGFAVDLVNLTLETEPVVLCAIHAERFLSVGAACRADPAAAAAAPAPAPPTTRKGWLKFIGSRTIPCPRRMRPPRWPAAARKTSGALGCECSPKKWCSTSQP